MQRMKLHFRGIQVPALGSPRDIVYRDYLIHEAKLEAKKHELLLLTTIASPFITEDNQRRAWDKESKRVFDEYVALLLGQETIPVNKEEQILQDFYAKVVKKTAPKLSRGKDGKLTVTGLPKL